MKRITAASLIALGVLSLTACSDSHQMINAGPDSITVSGSGEIAASRIFPGSGHRPRTG